VGNENAVDSLRIQEHGLEVFSATFESLYFLTLTFPGRLSGTAVTENPLYSTLLLFILGLGPFPRRKVRLGLR